VDDLTLGLDMTGSGSVARLNELPGLPTMRGKMLGERTSWGQWAHWFGRSAAFWKQDTSRLYVQAKLAPEGELCPPDEVRKATDQLMERMAILGVTSWERPWVTRVDVAVDASCAPADGKLLLDALEAARLPNGWLAHYIDRNAALDRLLPGCSEREDPRQGVLQESQAATGRAVRVDSSRGFAAVSAEAVASG
jgi:hypothetical protein